jgi:hypothetical protein
LPVKQQIQPLNTSFHGVCLQPKHCYLLCLVQHPLPLDWAAVVQPRATQIPCAPCLWQRPVLLRALLLQSGTGQTPNAQCFWQRSRLMVRVVQPGWKDAHSLATPTVLATEPSCYGGGSAAWMSAHNLTTVSGAESHTTSSVGGATRCSTIRCHRGAWCRVLVVQPWWGSLDPYTHGVCSHCA